MSIIGWIILGLIAGWLAGLIMRGGGYGIIGDIILGIIGALVGGFISSALLGIDVTGFNVTSLVIAVVGAIIVIAIARAVSPGRSTV
ncbi:MAG TPA: GlsB/YeaQ/YmgE family stress response membrane protein [Chloroflexota bacterium]|nr:GlsB/YeaQ/YmgE family stress response membrane protein [Chloroflexota bacterium]